LLKDREEIYGTLGDEFFSFFAKNMDRKEIYTTRIF
jgi:hypothetical protein